MTTVVLQDMSDVSEIYKELLTSDEGDILVKLKDGRQLKIISFLIKRRSPIFKSMLDSSMKEAATGVVDLSSEYSLEAFREFMAHIYYNKLYTGSYVPLMFEILCIAEYYDVESCRTYINDRILNLIADVPICLMIAAEALKHGTLTSEIYRRCLAFLVKSQGSQTRVCYDSTSTDSVAWCCDSHSTRNKGHYSDSYRYMYQVDGKIACVFNTLRRNNGYGNHAHQPSAYTQRCCVHDLQPKKQPANGDQLPDFIVDDVKSFRNDADGKSVAS